MESMLTLKVFRFLFPSIFDLTDLSKNWYLDPIEEFRLCIEQSDVVEPSSQFKVYDIGK